MEVVTIVATLDHSVGFTIGHGFEGTVSPRTKPSSTTTSRRTKARSPKSLEIYNSFYKFKLISFFSSHRDPMEVMPYSKKSSTVS